MKIGHRYTERYSQDSLTWTKPLSLSDINMTGCVINDQFVSITRELYSDYPDKNLGTRIVLINVMYFYTLKMK